MILLSHIMRETKFFASWTVDLKRGDFIELEDLTFKVN